MQNLKSNWQSAKRPAPINRGVFFALLMTTWCVSTAEAQETVSVEEALQICNKIANASDRLDCFEGLAKAAAPASSTEVRDGAKTREPNPREEAPAPADTTQQEVADQTPPEARGADTTAEKPAQRFVIIPEDEAKDRLLDKPISAREKGEKYTAKVRKAWRNASGKVFVLFDNGELWKQNQSTHTRVPKEGAQASFRKSRFGTWFVKLPPNYPAVRMLITNP
ncbi:MAG: hypothetical protein AAFY13_06845 [Pseudomonadota bacterium]